jgi:hypothetical protein
VIDDLGFDFREGARDVLFSSAQTGSDLHPAYQIPAGDFPPVIK